MMSKQKEKKHCKASGVDCPKWDFSRIRKWFSGEIQVFVFKQNVVAKRSDGVMEGENI